MHVSAVSASNCSGVGDKCSRKTSPNSSVGHTSNPCARKLRATAWRTSSVSRIACVACLTAPETDAETFPTHAHFALDGLPALTARPERLLHELTIAPPTPRRTTPHLGEGRESRMAGVG